MNGLLVCTQITHTTTQILFQPSVCRFSSVCCSIPHMKVFVNSKPHKLVLNRIQNCVFNIIQKLKKFCAYKFELVLSINICFLHFELHNIQLCSHHSLHHRSRLDHFPLLLLRSFTLQSNLHFALTFCPM